jgi:hypothetical protein
MPKVLVTETSFLETHVFQDPELLEVCVREVESKLLEGPEISVYGRVCRQPRDVAFFQNPLADGTPSQGYRYSGRTMAAQPLTDPLLQLLEHVNATFGSCYNGILVNRRVNSSTWLAISKANSHMKSLNKLKSPNHATPSPSAYIEEHDDVNL